MIDLVIAIHLEHRGDRKGSILQGISLIEKFTHRCYLLPGTFFPFHGTLGCAKSHIEALTLALRLGAKNVLVLEDDFVWTKKGKEIKKVFSAFMDFFQKDWDVFFFSTQLVQGLDSAHRDFIQVKQSLCAHSYLVNAHYIETLLGCFEKAALAMEKDENFKQSYYKAIDRAWHDLQQRDRWFMPRECLGGQGSFASDISLNHRNRLPI